jgi:hypothetical protein
VAIPKKSKKYKQKKEAIVIQKVELAANLLT